MRLVESWTLAFVAALSAPACAETPAAYCKRIGTDDASHPIPTELVPAVNAAFGLRLSERVATDTTVFRCTGGRVMICTTGANLPCGKANTRRTASAGVARWCRDTSDVSVVPAVVTGHDTIYEWRCRSGVALITRQALHVDPRGFIAELWKTLP